jgi:hypothetical protein
MSHSTARLTLWKCAICRGSDPTDPKVDIAPGNLPFAGPTPTKGQKGQKGQQVTGISE